MTELAGIEPTPGHVDDGLREKVAKALYEADVYDQAEVLAGGFPRTWPPGLDLSRQGFLAYADAALDTARPVIEAQFELARRVDGTLQLWVHTCGNAQWHDISYPPNAAPPAGSLGGCDACESGSDDPSDWQRVYVKAAKR